MKTIFIFLWFLFAVNAVAQPTLQVLPGTGNFLNGVSPSGRYATGTNSSGVFLYDISAQTIQSYSGIDAYAVNDSAVICGSFNDPNVFGNEAAGVLVGGSWYGPGLVPGIAASGSSYSHCFALANDGETFAGMYWENAGSTNAFIYSPATGWQTLDDYGSSARVNALSGDGALAGGWAQSNNRVPMFWDPDSLQLFSLGEVTDISNNGYYTVGFSGTEGFRRDNLNGSVTMINAINGYTGFKATSVTDDGWVAGSLQSGFLPPLTNTAAIWIPWLGLQTLQDYYTANGGTMPGSLSFLSNVTDLSKDGKFVGGFNTGIGGGSWIMDISPLITSHEEGKVKTNTGKGVSLLLTEPYVEFEMDNQLCTSYTLLDMTGRVLLNEINQQGPLLLDFSKFASGSYVLYFQDMVRNPIRITYSGK